MSKKSEYRVKDIQAYLAYINSEAKVSQKLEFDEKFLVKSAPAEQLLELMKWYKNQDGSGLEDHIEVLHRAINTINNLS